MAIEQYRQVVFRKDLNVKYTDSNGVSGIWNINQEFLLKKIVEIVESYLEQNITLTNRQLYYQLVASGAIPNADAVYKRICTFLTDARYGGYIDWDAIEDRGREPTIPLEFNSIKERVELALNNFRLKRWSDQEYYIEIFCEKQALESVLKPIAQKWQVVFGYNKGYSSSASMYELATRIKEKINEDKKCIVLYFGDHDPSGLDMVRDIKERIEEFLTKGEEYYDPEKFEIVPLALNMGQIKKYNPPPNPAKITDPRAKRYIKEFGKISWELDALNPTILQDLAQKGVLNYLDVDLYKSWIKKEEKDSEELRKFADKLE